jgi:Na+-transporting methylmalonyl-CoA/oxaloacetate decarboxylase gamma subunit
MSFESAITIILTALGVMLAVLAIMIGTMAIFGYGEIRKFLQSTVERKVEAEITKMTQTVKDEIFSRLEPNVVAISAGDKIKQNVSGVSQYPEELPNAEHGDTGNSDAGTNNL